MDNITESPDFDIRYSKEEDLPFLQTWLDKPEVNRWLPVSSQKDVEMLSKNWIGFSKYGASLTATYKGDPIGVATLFLMPYRKVIHHSLIYIVVGPDHWKQGVGTALLRNIFHLGKSYFRFEKMHLEVYEGCPLIPLLEKGGFHEVCRQEHFIKEADGNYLAKIIYEKVCDGK